MKHNYDQRFFRTVSNAPGGETGAETVFHYRQEGEVVWATYKGGEVVFGTLLATADEEGRLDMRYQQLNRRGEWRMGRCLSVPEVLADGRYRLHESWQWLTGDRSSGTSIIEEFRAGDHPIHS
jgi:hypothetical protein